MYRLILLIILTFIGCNKEISEHDLLHKSDPLGSYGGTISLTDVEKIGYLVDNSEKYLNSNVLISLLGKAYWSSISENWFISTAAPKPNLRGKYFETKRNVL